MSVSFGLPPSAIAPRTKKEGRFRISAIIPIHNDVRDLPALLADLQNQTVMPVDILCVDLHSTDGSAELAEKLGAQVYRADSALLRQAGSSGGNGGKCRLFNGFSAFFRSNAQQLHQKRSTPSKSARILYAVVLLGLLAALALFVAGITSDAALPIGIAAVSYLFAFCLTAIHAQSIGRFNRVLCFFFPIPLFFFVAASVSRSRKAHGK